MKTALVAILTVLSISTPVFADPSIEAFDQAQYEGNSEDLQGLPTALLCEGLILTQTNSLEPRFQRDFSESPETELLTSVKVNGERDQILFDSLDGDQIDSLLFSKNDLLALAAGSVEKVFGHKYTGFWWRDGKQLEASVVACSLLPSK